MTNPFRRAAELTGSALAKGLRERLVEPRALRKAYRRGERSGIQGRIAPVCIGDVEVGLAMFSGEARWAGATARYSTPRDFWLQSPSFTMATVRARSGAQAAKPKGPLAATPWRRAAHSFAWLADLSAVGGDAANDLASEITRFWIKMHLAEYDAQVWDPETAAERILHWLSHVELITPRVAASDGPEQIALYSAVEQHADWLIDRLEPATPGLPRFRVAAAILASALSLNGWEDRRPAAAKRFEEAAISAMRSDGGVVGRRPDAIYNALMVSLAIQAAYDALEEAPPPSLEPMIRQFGAALRFFRMSDGGAPLFHGGRAIGDGRIDLALAGAPLDRTIPKTMPESGYARMSGGRVAVVMDVGRAPGGAHAEAAHASCLAFEVSSGRRRVIVSCGAGEGLEGEWARTRRQSAAHSTIVVDGKSSAAPTLTGRWRAFGEDRAIVGPPETHAERKEERNGVWILGAHDAYFDEYGLTLTRRMFLSADGGDFRGEDNLEALEDGARIFERKLAPRRGAGVAFEAFFHLHPDVSPELVADGEAVTLRLPHGEVWVMRQAGGRLFVEPSVYAPEDGQIRRTKKIVVRGHAIKKSTQLRWAFRRVGEVTQLPLDVDALLAPVEATALSADDSALTLAEFDGGPSRRR